MDLFFALFCKVIHLLQIQIMVGKILQHNILSRKISHLVSTIKPSFWQPLMQEDWDNSYSGTS